ncbi:MAG TPA: hypothetical protein VLI90_00830 [Tepidisphaeraceae bacterium]|nr:hypothetical protein [Tepidisphaeraceae bacterium]
MSLKPGDVINNCTLFNHVICKIELWWDRPDALRGDKCSVGLN